ncbi:MAG: Wzz/FepE/Etk N-terminal domain-containing protein [Bacteroidales bacterium]|nr:Wzz/FepE/Etk N-terminal domain-containing protein [Bacteroidales bacterium]
MNESFEGNRDFDSSNFIQFLWAWRKPILIVTSIAFAASLIFSAPFFITPKYKSIVVLYPVSTSSVSKALLSESYGGKEDILEFGEDEQTEQMLQILNSNRIRDRIIQKYDLMNHYEVDKNSKYKLTRLYKQYESNITYRRTEYNAVKITVMDQNAQLAADIANDIANLLDSIKIDMQRQRAIRGFKIVESEYLQRLAEIHKMEDSLTFLRKKGVHDYETQAEMINQQLAIEIAKNNTYGIRALEAKLDTLAKYGGPYVSLRDALEHEKKQLSVLKSKYEEAKVDAEEELPQKFVVSTAYGAERKSYPIRWLIILVATVSAFLLTVLVIIIVENISKSESMTFAQKKKFKFNFRIPQVNFKIKQPTIRTPQVPNNNKWKMEHFFNNMNLLQLLWRWKWHIAVICLIAGLVAAIFSGPSFISPKFKSVSVIYPSNIAPYSDESETEQMVQWLNSKDIKDSVIHKFNLAKHYKIDSSYKYFYSTILYKYNKNVQINKTMYESVEIVVMDADPQIACAMVNEIIHQFDRKVQAIHREKYIEVVKATQEMLDQKQREIDSTEAKLYELRTRYEIIDYSNQTREVARGYLRTVDGDNAARNINTAEVIKLKKNIEEKGGEFIYYNTRLYDLLRLYGEFQEDYDRAVYDANKNFTHANIVTPPVVADKKSYPIRWIIVFLTMASTLLLTTVLVVIFDGKLSVIAHKG